MLAKRKRPYVPSLQVYYIDSGEGRADENGDVAAERDKNGAAGLCLEGCEEMLPLLGLAFCMEPKCDLQVL